MSNEEPVYAFATNPVKPAISVVLEPGAICPTRGTPDSAGYDLYALEDTYIGPTSTLVKTGVRMKIPKGYVGIIKSRSSMACKNGVYTEAGVIDSDYFNVLYM